MDPVLAAAYAAIVIKATQQLWKAQDRHPGDRWRLFRATASHVDAATVLYPGSFVDVAPSFVFPSVTYVDVDKRARSFFADTGGVLEIVAAYPSAPANPEIQFIHGDYRQDVGLEPDSYDLLVSLYAGLVSDSCTRYLRIGGTLLANSSHGDVAIAAADTRYRLRGVVISQSGDYYVSEQSLETYLVPKSGETPGPDEIRRRGRGIAYSKSAFAYLFERCK